MPGQRGREVFAGDAFAQSTIRFDSVRDGEGLARGTPHSALRSGIGKEDTTRRPRIRDLLAHGNARSYYQVATREGRNSPPSINYVRGRIITVTFQDQEVDRVSITDQAAGVYLEAPHAAADSALATPRDTVPPATRRPPSSDRRTP